MRDSAREVIGLDGTAYVDDLAHRPSLRAEYHRRLAEAMEAKEGAENALEAIMEEVTALRTQVRMNKVELESLFHVDENPAEDTPDGSLEPSLQIASQKARFTVKLASLHREREDLQTELRIARETHASDLEHARSQLEARSEALQAANERRIAELNEKHQREIAILRRELSIAHQRSSMLSGDLDALMKAGIESSAVPASTKRASGTTAVRSPLGSLAIVFTDIQNSTMLWASASDYMESALKTHDSVMRDEIRLHRGYEVKTIGDAFMIAFESVVDALQYCLSVQSRLTVAPWPAWTASAKVPQDLETVRIIEPHSGEQTVLWAGLRVRMGIHYGEPTPSLDVVSGRMDYLGPMVNKASRVQSTAKGGVICLSSEVYSEVKDKLMELGCPIVHARPTKTMLKGIAEGVQLYDCVPHHLASRLMQAATKGVLIRGTGTSTTSEGLSGWIALVVVTVAQPKDLDPDALGESLQQFWATVTSLVEKYAGFSSPHPWDQEESRVIAFWHVDIAISFSCDLHNNLMTLDWPIQATLDRAWFTELHKEGKRLFYGPRARLSIHLTSIEPLKRSEAERRGIFGGVPPQFESIQLPASCKDHEAMSHAGSRRGSASSRRQSIKASASFAKLEKGASVLDRSGSIFGAEVTHAVRSSLLLAGELDLDDEIVYGGYDVDIAAALNCMVPPGLTLCTEAAWSGINVRAGDRTVVINEVVGKFIGIPGSVYSVCSHLLTDRLSHLCVTTKKQESPLTTQFNYLGEDMWKARYAHLYTATLPLARRGSPYHVVLMQQLEHVNMMLCDRALEPFQQTESPIHFTIEALLSMQFSAVQPEEECHASGRVTRKRTLSNRIKTVSSKALELQNMRCVGSSVVTLVSALSDLALAARNMRNATVARGRHPIESICDQVEESFFKDLKDIDDAASGRLQLAAYHTPSAFYRAVADDEPGMRDPSGGEHVTLWDVLKHLAVALQAAKTMALLTVHAKGRK